MLEILRLISVHWWCEYSQDQDPDRDAAFGRKSMQLNIGLNLCLSSHVR